MYETQLLWYIYCRYFKATNGAANEYYLQTPKIANASARALTRIHTFGKRSCHVSETRTKENNQQNKINQDNRHTPAGKTQHESCEEEEEENSNNNSRTIGTAVNIKLCVRYLFWYGNCCSWIEFGPSHRKQLLGVKIRHTANEQTQLTSTPIWEMQPRWVSLWFSKRFRKECAHTHTHTLESVGAKKMHSHKATKTKTKTKRARRAHMWVPSSSSSYRHCHRHRLRLAGGPGGQCGTDEAMYRKLPFSAIVQHHRFTIEFTIIGQCIIFIVTKSINQEPMMIPHRIIASFTEFIAWLRLRLGHDSNMNFYEFLWVVFVFFVPDTLPTIHHLHVLCLQPYMHFFFSPHPNLFLKISQNQVCELNAYATMLAVCLCRFVLSFGYFGVCVCESCARDAIFKTQPTSERTNEWTSINEHRFRRRWKEMDG